MSRAFVKEDAAQEAVVVNARADLPEGERNLVTPRGLALLQQEQRTMQDELERLQDGGDPRRQQEVELAMEALVDRLRSAVLLPPGPTDQVRFGHTVTLRSRSAEGKEQLRRLSLVGVDEADPAHGRVAFVAPIARLLLGKRVGDLVTQRRPQGLQTLEVVAVE